LTGHRVPAIQLGAFGCVTVHVSLQQVPSDKGPRTVWVVTMEGLLRVVVELMTISSQPGSVKNILSRRMVINLQMLCSRVAFAAAFSRALESLI
jgi:hypothetical protein